MINLDTNLQIGRAPERLRETGGSPHAPSITAAAGNAASLTGGLHPQQTGMQVTSRQLMTWLQAGSTDTAALPRSAPSGHGMAGQGRPNLVMPGRLSMHQLRAVRQQTATQRSRPERPTLAEPETGLTEVPTVEADVGIDEHAHALEQVLRTIPDQALATGVLARRSTLQALASRPDTTGVVLRQPIALATVPADRLASPDLPGRFRAEIGKGDMPDQRRDTIALELIRALPGMPDNLDRPGQSNPLGKTIKYLQKLLQPAGPGITAAHADGARNNVLAALTQAYVRIGVALRPTSLASLRQRSFLNGAGTTSIASATPFSCMQCVTGAGAYATSVRHGQQFMMKAMLGQSNRAL